METTREERNHVLTTIIREGERLDSFNIRLLSDADLAEELLEALEMAELALADWVNTHAPEHCDIKRVKQAYDRIMDHGGTLAYIGHINQRIRAAKAKARGED